MGKSLKNNSSSQVFITKSILASFLCQSRFDKREKGQQQILSTEAEFVWKLMAWD